MKVVFVFIVTLLLAVTWLPAQTISGRLGNAMENTVYLYYSYDGLYQQADTLALDEAGNFSAQFNFNKLGKVIVVCNSVSYTFNVFPGAKINFETDVTDNRTINTAMRVTGKGSEINIDYRLFNDEALNNIKWDYALSPDSFVLRLTDWREKKDSLRKVLVRQKAKIGYGKYILQFLQVDSLNDLYWTVGGYRDYHSSTLHKKSEEDIFFQKHIKPYIFSTDNENYLAADRYKYFWKRYVWNKYFWKKQSKDSSELNDLNPYAFHFEEIKKITKGKLQKIVLASILQSDFVYNYEYEPVADFPVYDSLLERYGKEIPNPEVLVATRSKIDIKKHQRAITATGQPAPDFLLADSSGKTYSLKDFAGKTVYIDAWASWCGPCIAELPDYKKLVDKFKDRQAVIFVSVSIDDTKTAWIEKGLNKHHPPGLQLWAGKGGWRSTFAKNYYISGVPQYILIDGEGKIIDFNAPRPSSGEKIGNAIAEALKN